MRAHTFTLGRSLLHSAVLCAAIGVLTFANAQTTVITFADACTDGTSDLSDIPGDKQILFCKRTAYGSPVDRRLSERLRTNGGAVRSYAVIISISEYPKFLNPDEQHLEPAAQDLKRLKIFLRSQGFDEVIVLENGTATTNNIEYVLDSYLIDQLDVFGSGARVLFAYSGHGTPDALVLGNAKHSKDNDGLYRLSKLEAQLKTLGSKSYQFVALINACNSGGLFSQYVHSGGDDFSPGGTGAHAITASTADELAYALPNAYGSIFFNALIDGVNSGTADFMCAGWGSREDGTRFPRGGGYVRLGSLAGYLAEAIPSAGINPKTNKPYSQPIWGNIRTEGSKGAFFFLVPQSQQSGWAVTTTTTTSENTTQTSIFDKTTGSAVVGLPSCKVFDPPDTYSILGVDVTSYNADIDWAQVATAPKVKFAYIRATTLRPHQRKDSEFDRNWLGAHAAGLRRGAYHTYDAHMSAVEQFEVIKANVPRDPDALPLAIDPDATFYSMIGTNTTIAPNSSTALEELPKLQKLCSEYFGKPTVLYGPTRFFKRWGERIGSESAIWLARYRPPEGKPVSPTAESLPGTQPWTLWQFTDSATIGGIEGKSDLNAFFGTVEQFDSFARGDKSVALNAALPFAK